MWHARRSRRGSRCRRSARHMKKRSHNGVIPSEVEESRGVSLDISPRDSPTSLCFGRDDGGRLRFIRADRKGGRHG